MNSDFDKIFVELNPNVPCFELGANVGYKRLDLNFENLINFNYHIIDKTGN